MMYSPSLRSPPLSLFPCMYAMSLHTMSPLLYLLSFLSFDYTKLQVLSTEGGGGGGG